MNIELPASLAKISKQLPKELLAEAMGSAIRKRINEEKRVLKQAEKKIGTFEKRYKNVYSVFVQKISSKQSAQAHQDWVEWTFWEKVRQQAKNDLVSFSKIYKITHQ